MLKSEHFELKLHRDYWLDYYYLSVFMVYTKLDSYYLGITGQLPFPMIQREITHLKMLLIRSLAFYQTGEWNRIDSGALHFPFLNSSIYLKWWTVCACSKSMDYASAYIIK